MLFQKGYVYHIKDEYFNIVNDSKLMQNKENGNYRPTYYCMKDVKTSLLWVVPMSTQAEKYQKLYNEKCARYGKCDTIVLANYDGKRAAFLLQNMFPITEKYLDHIHTRNNNPVPVSMSIQKEIESKMKRIFVLQRKGKKLVFPDIIRLESIMLHEIENERTVFSQPLRIKDRLAALKPECDRINAKHSINRAARGKDDIDR